MYFLLFSFDAALYNIILPVSVQKKISRYAWRRGKVFICIHHQIALVPNVMAKCKEINLTGEQRPAFTYFNALVFETKQKIHIFRLTTYYQFVFYIKTWLYIKPKIERTFFLEDSKANMHFTVSWMLWITCLTCTPLVTMECPCNEMVLI